MHPCVVAPTGRTTTPAITLAAAGEALWDEGGAYAYATYRRLRDEHFPTLPDELLIVIGLTAYGHCLGLTRSPWEHGARTLAPLVFRQGRRMVDDVLIHEMLHASLMAQGRDPKHAGADWYAEVARLSPAILGHALEVQRPQCRSVRIPNPSYGPDDRRTTVVRIHAAIAPVAGSLPSRRLRAGGANLPANLLATEPHTAEPRRTEPNHPPLPHTP